MALNTKNIDKVRAEIPISDAIKTKQVRVTFNTTEATRDDWKRAAIDLKLTVTELIHCSVKQYLNKDSPI